MQTQTFTIVYATVFIIIEMIWLVTIRNRNIIILVSCATVMVGVEGFFLILGFKAEYQSFPEYIEMLFLIDTLILLSIWSFLYAKPQFKLNEAGSLRSNLVGWLDFAWSLFETMIRNKWYRSLLFLLFIFLCISISCKSCSNLSNL